MSDALKALVSRRYSCTNSASELQEKAVPAPDPPVRIPMLLWCPMCHTRHIDDGEFARKAHHTHACQSCGFVWRPAVECTQGVQFLPGYGPKPPAK